MCVYLLLCKRERERERWSLTQFDLLKESQFWANGGHQHHFYSAGHLVLFLALRFEMWRVDLEQNHRRMCNILGERKKERNIFRIACSWTNTVRNARGLDRSDKTINLIIYSITKTFHHHSIVNFGRRCSFSEIELVVIKVKSIRCVFSLLLLSSALHVRTFAQIEKVQLKTWSDDWHSGPYRWAIAKERMQAATPLPTLTLSCYFHWQRVGDWKCKFVGLPTQWEI